MMKLRFFSSFSFFSLLRGSLSNNCSLPPVLLSGIAAAMLLMLPAPAQAASFDCAKAQSKVEHLVCDNPILSKLDSKLGQDYQDVLSKASDEQKQRVVAEQKHWLQHTRNVCETETCLKHAYWSRQAALEAWFEPRSPLYQKESDKAEDIKKVLATAPLYPMYDTPFCRQTFSDLKEMKGIRFVDPVVQTQSYEDPGLDPWKKNCRTERPFHTSIWCNRPETLAIDPELEVCHVDYGLPPFKVFELPPSATSKTKRIVLYSDERCGPMNKPRGPMDKPIEPVVGGGFGFLFINPENCSVAATFAAAAPQDRGSRNYNSIIEYQGSYYFLIVKKSSGKDWLSVVAADDRKQTCDWAPVKLKQRSDINQGRNSHP